MTAFRISQEVRDKLELFDVVVGTATQPAWLRWNYARDAADPKTESSPWEIQLYPNVPFPAINSKPVATGLGRTPDLAVESALSSPSVRYRSGIYAALYRLEVEVNALTWASSVLRHRVDPPMRFEWSSSRPWADDFDDDIPF